MKVERVTTVHYTFQKGDIVANSLNDGATIVRLLFRTKVDPTSRYFCWRDQQGEPVGLLDSDIQNNLENFPDTWRYLGNKYEVFN